MSAPLVSFGVLSYNRREELRATLRQLEACDYPAAEILVLDNGSADGSAGMVEREFSSAAPFPVILIRKSANSGIAARNELFDRAKGKYFFSFDDDSRPSAPGMVAAAVEIMERDPSVAALCCSCIHPSTGYNETRGIERFSAGGDREAGFDLLNVAEGGTLFRMEDIRKTAGYDARLFFSREGNDLGFQLLRLGKRILFRPELVVHHLMSPAGRQEGLRLMYFTRNTFWILWKYFPLPVALPVAMLFAARRIAPAIVHPRRLGPVLMGIVRGTSGFRTMRRGASRFSIGESVAFRKWFLKTLYE